MAWGKKAQSPGEPALREVSSDSGLEAVRLDKRYNRRPVVRDLSLSVRRGEVVGLLGPNGAGKTTTFHILCGLISADSGAVLLDGRDITKLPMFRRARLGIGYLPQESSVFRGLSVVDNLRAVLELTEPDRAEREAMIAALLEEFDLERLSDTPASALSGGERRRVEIARALAARPHFMLLDEPLAGVDPIAVADMRDLIGVLSQRGIGVLITDHKVRETLELVDRAYVMHEGAVLAAGPPGELVANERVIETYLGKGFRL
ncbi:MAG: LPS export ABC transporter ATP-binding protein [Alphaproteobacteria bacterium]|nr:LPS export ABC transporter ATP-binding protein [Alphaproteobacteria bacterium]